MAVRLVVLVCLLGLTSLSAHPQFRPDYKQLTPGVNDPQTPPNSPACPAFQPCIGDFVFVNVLPGVGARCLVVRRLAWYPAAYLADFKVPNTETYLRLLEPSWAKIGPGEDWRKWAYVLGADPARCVEL